MTMASSSSAIVPSFSSSCTSSACATCRRKEKTVCNKAYELSILCGIDVCLICYESNNNFKIWPADNPVKVRDMAERFIELPEAARRIRRVSARNVLEAKDKPNSPQKKKQKTIKSNSGEEYSTFSPDDHSSERLKEALVSLQLKFKSIHEPKPVKQQQQQQQLSTTNQDYSDLFEKEDWSNPNLAYNDEECLAILKGEDIGNNQEKQETWNQYLDRPIDPNSDDIHLSDYLQDFSDQKNREISYEEILNL